MPKSNMVMRRIFRSPSGGNPFSVDGCSQETNCGGTLYWCYRLRADPQTAGRLDLFSCLLTMPQLPLQIQVHLLSLHIILQ